MPAGRARSGLVLGALLRTWRAWVPIALALLVAATPHPGGLPAHAWHFFALFVGVVAGLVLEPIPNAAVGLVGVAVALALPRWVLFGPEDLARPGFDVRLRALEWALSGFQSPVVWLAFSAFMFGLGYDRTSLGRRVALWVVRALGDSTLRLGYAVVAVDALLAPFTPSNTARSAGIVYPVIRGIPHLYGSEPDSPTARRIGTYLLWTAFASSCVTSSLFLTALAPNLIAAEFMRRMVGLDVGWLQWLGTAAPFAVPLLVALPLLGYVLCPPELRSSPEVSAWAARELAGLGPPSRREVVFAILLAAALAAWIVGEPVIHPAAVALVVLALMLLLRVVRWDEMASHATTTTAHTIAVFPVMLSVGLAIPGLRVETFAVVLALSHGIMGVISPYATGPAPVYHGSGYLPSGLFWRLGAVFGAIFLGALLLLAFPAALALWR